MSAMFLGTHSPRLDDKGRLALPARFRPELEGGLVICKGQDRCLFVFPTESSPGSPPPSRTRRSPTAGCATTAGSCSPAPPARRRTGRAASPFPRSCATTPGLTKDCVVIGANSRIEIWDAETWRGYLDNTEQAFADIAEEVLPGVL